MKKTVRKIMFFVSMISLVAISSYAGGVSVGNSKAYISPKGFSITYREELSLVVNSDSDFRISNEGLVRENEPRSRVNFRVSESEIKDWRKLREWIAKSHSGKDLIEITFPGAKGYYYQTKGNGSIESRYFLLTSNGELVDIFLEAYEIGRGIELVAPIVNTFAYDSTPPVVEKVWIDVKAWPAGTKQKVYFRASDDNSGVDARQVIIFLSRVGKPKGRRWLSAFGAKEEAPGLYSAEIQLNPHIAPGRFELNEVNLSDHAGNRVNHYLEKKIEIEVKNDAVVDEEKPVWGGFREDNSVWKAGETKRLFFRATDAISGISVGSLRCLGLQSLFHVDGYPRSSSDCEDPREEGDGWYSVAIKVSPYLPSGEYALYSLTVADRAEMTTEFYTCSVPSEFYCNEEGALTNQRVFKVSIESGEKLDLEKPELLEMRFASTTWKTGEKQRVYVKAKDNLSGLSFERYSPRGWMRPEKVQPGAVTFFLDQPLMPMGGDWYFMDITVKKYLRDGDYYLERFWISDKAGNVAGVNCDHPETLKECRKSDGSSMKPVRIRLVR